MKAPNSKWFVAILSSLLLAFICNVSLGFAQEFTHLTVEQEAFFKQPTKDNDIAIRRLRYRVSDIETLDILTLDEPSEIFSVFPRLHPNKWRASRVNLYRQDGELSDPFRLDMRVSSKLSFEARSKYLDGLVILNPLKTRVRLGLIHKISKNAHTTIFYDPIRQETLAMFLHRLRDDLEYGLAYSWDVPDQRQVVFAHMQVRF